MQNDREAGQLLLDCGQYVECQRRRYQTAGLGIYGALLGRELECAVRRADRDRQRVDAGLGNEVHDLFGLGIVAYLGSYLVLDTGQHAQLALDRDVVLVGILDDLAREGDILVIGQGRTVDHYRREAHVDAALAQLEAVAVVEMQDDLRLLPAQLLGILDGTLGHVAQQRLVGVVARTLRYLQNHGRLGLGRSHDDRLQLLHVVEIECRNRVTSVNGLLEHLFGVHKTQLFVRYHNAINL